MMIPYDMIDGDETIYGYNTRHDIMTRNYVKHINMSQSVHFYK
jgi:hypothetical protein